MDRSEIMALLPHRDDMLLLDWAQLDEGGAIGRYAVRGDEFFLRGHFPGNPVVPGVILCEIMAQSSCILLGDELRGRTPYLAGLGNVRFRRPVRPGEVIQTRVSLKRHKLGIYQLTGEARVAGEVCAEGEFTCALR